MKNFLILSHLYRIEATQQLHCLVSSNITFTKHYIDKDRTPPTCLYAACLIVFMLRKERQKFCDGSSARPEDRFCAMCVCTVFLTPVRQICSSVEAGPPCRQQLKRVWWWWCSDLIWGGSWWRYLLSGLRESERWEEGENGGLGVWEELWDLFFSGFCSKGLWKQVRHKIIRDFAGLNRLIEI